MWKSVGILAIFGALLALYLSDINLSIVNQRKNEKKKYVLLTAEELSQYDGVHQPFLYLSILGIIFNVTEGKKHYGVGKQYNFFVGKDASRSFVTGKFNDNDASDDVGGLSLQELQSLNNWLKFYSKDYQEVGKLVGRYYNELGELTPYAKQIKKLILEAEDVEKNSQLEKIQFPPCNIEWSAEKGSRVWCTTRSGGIQRSWTGKPRQYYEPGSKTYRCACINEENEKLGVIKEYPHCNKNSESCYVNL